MNKVTVILNVYKRHEYLAKQIEALRNQTVPTDIWIDYTVPEGEPMHDILAMAPEAKVTVRRNQNLYHIGRFYYALNVDTEYVFIVDDDIIPGSNYIQHCINTMQELGDCVLTAYGIRFGKGTTQYKSKSIHGWNRGSNQNQDKPIQVDMAGHSWFFKRKYLSCITREDPPSRKNGEDLHFSYCVQKYEDLPIYVPTHKAGEYENWSSDYAQGMLYGNDKNATHKLPDHGELRHAAVAHYVSRGWKFIEQ